MESSTHATTAVALRLWRIVRAVFYMVRKGIARRKLMVDLHLLLKRGKLAGKAIGNLIHHHHQSSAAAARDLHFSDCSCRSGLDQDMLFYDPKGVQLSCSNTPSYAYYYSHATAKTKTRRRRRDDCYDAAAVAKAIELLNNEYSTDAESSAVSSALPTPSPMLGIRTTPVGRQLRITDSPFMMQEDDVADVGRIDKEADEFISRFYEQLRRQQLVSAAATPEYHAVRGRKTVAARA